MTKIGKILKSLLDHNFISYYKAGEPLLGPSFKKYHRDLINELSGETDTINLLKDIYRKKSLRSSRYLIGRSLSLNKWIDMVLKDPFVIEDLGLVKSGRKKPQKSNRKKSPKKKRVISYKKRVKRRAPVYRKKRNPWNTHVRRVARANLGLPYRDILQLASSTYVKKSDRTRTKRCQGMGATSADIFGRLKPDRISAGNPLGNSTSDLPGYIDTTRLLINPNPIFTPPLDLEMGIIREPEPMYQYPGYKRTKIEKIERPLLKRASSMPPLEYVIDAEESKYGLPIIREEEDIKAYAPGGDQTSITSMNLGPPMRSIPRSGRSSFDQSIDRIKRMALALRRNG